MKTSISAAISHAPPYTEEKEINMKMKYCIIKDINDRKFARL